MTRGDVKADENPRFPRIAASLAPLFAVGGVLLFARELRLGRLFGEPAQATLTITTLASALGAASLVALLVRGRRVHGPVPYPLLALVTVVPTAVGASLPGADAGHYVTALWCSAWLNGALAWVAVIEVFSTMSRREQNPALWISAALALTATALCAWVSLALVPFAVLAWALPMGHLARPGDAKAEGALLSAPVFAAVALWLGHCAMLRAGILTQPSVLTLVACACLALDVLVGIWVVRPRALAGLLPLVLILGGWSASEGVRSKAPESVEVIAPAPIDDGEGLRVPYTPRR
ncbi:MAG: hypothetical protein AB8H86_07435 [Polyangiales bacterium]